MKIAQLFLPALAMCLSMSCAQQYEYKVLKPVDHQATVTNKEPVTIDSPPVRFALQTEDTHLVVRVYNTTAKPISLVGAKSFVVDPSGQSRRLPDQLIPGQSFVKFMLPPVRPVLLADSGVSPGGTYTTSPIDEYGTGYDDLSTYTVRDGGAIYWDWKGDGPARMSLTFQIDGKAQTEDFEFQRSKLN